MSNVTLEFQSPVDPLDQQALIEGMLSHHAETYGDPRFESFGLFLRGEGGEVEAGLTGRIRWGWLYVEMLWVRKELRRYGRGSSLLAGAEAHARNLGCAAVHLEANGPLALPFYRKRGYEIVGVLQGFPPGSQQHFMRKWLTDTGPVDGDDGSGISYSKGNLPVSDFLGLARRIWPREYDASSAEAALARTTNFCAWDGPRLVGSVRVLSDGYFLSTVPEILVDPEYQRRGIGRELMRLALASAPRGKLFFGAQPQSEAFFRHIGAASGPAGMVLDATGLR
jgi:ribosomal protein S18 acetylase RimI-like enzyme